MAFAFNCLGLEVNVVGEAPEVIGEYRHHPAWGGPADLRIELQCPVAWPNSSVNFDPLFELLSFSDDELSLRRHDAEGSFIWQADGSLCGRFRAARRPSGLEAIIRIGMSLLLPERDALILHSSCVADARGAHIFSGVSGAGKSTIATLLAQSCPVTKLSDELLIVKRNADGFWVHVAPFAGNRDLPHNGSAPLSSINLLHKATEHTREPVQPRVAMREICRHVVNFARSARTMAKVLELASDIVESVPCYELHFAKNSGVRDVLGITCASEGA